MNILLVAGESAGIRVLREVVKTSLNVTGVMAKRSKDTSSVWGLANRLKLQTWDAKLVKDPNFAMELKSKDIDLILNIHSQYIFCQEMITVPRFGSYNLHPGPLPQYAGLNPVSWAIYNGEKHHGVTLHRMVPQIDAGPIIYQDSFPIANNDTALMVMEKCVLTGVKLINRFIQVMIETPESLTESRQDNSRRCYFSKKIPQDGWIDWNFSAQKIYNFVRACQFEPFVSPWGHPKTKLGEEEFRAMKVEMTDRSDVSGIVPGSVHVDSGQNVCVAAADSWLILDDIVVRGERYKAIEIIPDCSILK